NTLYAAYGQGEVEVPGITADTDAWTIAAMHKMSKRTMVYAGYNNFEEEDNVGFNLEEDTFSLGLKHKF
ncbi:MAG: porin, partial [Gammaproteobacteria bacterium]|nr:porin [Gammaproteobacteria bacterium]